jgi:ribokinase
VTDSSGAGEQVDAAFVGRANIDLTIHVPHRAQPGRTATGSPLTVNAGGKSLNQAIAAARRGGRAALVANVGADTWAHQITTALADVGVDTRHVRLIPDATTGAAIIEVTPDGESYITLARSPATELTANDIHRATAALATEAVIVQLDLPPEPVTTLLSHRRAPIVIGNLVPHPNLDPRLLAELDVLVVNQHEAAAILRTTAGNPLDAAAALQRLGPRTVIVTAGSNGAAFTHPHGSGTVPAPAVPVVDTTGAGDALLGCLALDLARHTPLSDAITTAVHAGSRTVGHSGAHTVTHQIP